MKNSVLAGAVAGLVAGIIGVLAGALGATLGLFGIPPIDPMTWSIYWLIITTIFGAIFGMIYAKMFDAIPGKGLKKGLTAGLAIWLIKDVATATYLGAEGVAVSVPAILWVGFFIWASYGLVIGKLYQK
jgi:hypothetical protein